MISLYNHMITCVYCRKIIIVGNRDNPNKLNGWTHLKGWGRAICPKCNEKQK